jgi:hypothetical protein
MRRGFMRGACEPPTWFAVCPPRGASEPILPELNRAAFATAGSAGQLLRRVHGVLEARRRQAVLNVRRRDDLGDFAAPLLSACRPASAAADSSSPASQLPRQHQRPERIR